MDTILSLKANVTRDEAVRQFQGRGFAPRLRSLMRGPLRSVAAVYVPFRLFRVEIRNAGRTQVQWLALDSVQGAFDPYAFDGGIPAHLLHFVHTRNHPQPALPAEQGRRLVAEKVRRIVFQTGFFRVRNLEIEVDPQSFPFYVPYWIGFSGKRNSAHLPVLDAVRRRKEGPKIRHFFQEWFSQ